MAAGGPHVDPSLGARVRNVCEEGLELADALDDPSEKEADTLIREGRVKTTPATRPSGEFKLPREDVIYFRKPMVVGRQLDACGRLQAPSPRDARIVGSRNG